jgi:hypothetical protein
MKDNEDLDDDCYNLLLMMMMEKEDLSLSDSVENRVNDQSLNILELNSYCHNLKTM